MGQGAAAEGGPPPRPPHRLDLPEPPLAASPAASRVLGARQGRLVWGRLAAGAWPPGAQCGPPGGPGGGLSHPPCLSSFSAVRLLQGGPSASGRVVSLAAGARAAGAAHGATRASAFPLACPRVLDRVGCTPASGTEGRSGAWARTWRLGPARALTLTGNCQGVGGGVSALGLCSWRLRCASATFVLHPEPRGTSLRPQPCSVSVAECQGHRRGDYKPLSLPRSLVPNCSLCSRRQRQPRGGLLLQLGVSAPGSCSGIEVRASPASSSFPMMSQNKLAC